MNNNANIRVLQQLLSLNSMKSSKIEKQENNFFVQRWEKTSETFTDVVEGGNLKGKMTKLDTFPSLERTIEVMRRNKGEIAFAEVVDVVVKADTQNYANTRIASLYAIDGQETKYTSLLR